MNTHLKRLVVIVAGVLSMVVGLLGTVIPFLPGFVFVIAGIVLLTLASKLFRNWVHSYTERHPNTHNRLLALETWLQKHIGPIDEY